MAKIKIPTTTIGSFPKPDYLPIRDWFDSARGEDGMNTEKITLEFTNYKQNRAENHEELFLKAAKEILTIQDNIGIDILTDGEVRRENYVHYHCRHLEGFDFENLEQKVLRGGAYQSKLPSIRDRIRHVGDCYASHDFLSSQSMTKKAVKFTLPGPLTIMDTSADCFYDDRNKLNIDLAQTLNREILELVQSGCKYIQIDEPLFARQVDDALSFGIEGIERCFHNVPNDITKIIHICCGYTDRLDDEEYIKADPQSYFALAGDLNLMKIDQISIEDCHFKNDLSLLQKLDNKTVIFGVLNVTKSRIESTEEIQLRLSEVLKYIDRERLVVSPDCGLGLLDISQAKKKLHAMCSAVKNL